MTRLHDASDTLWLREGTLRVGVVADTHSKPNVEGLEHLRALRPHAILHAGDIGDLGVLAQLETIAPTLAVRGNIDEHAAEVPDTRTIDVRDAEGSLTRLFLLHIAVHGPRLRADVAKRAHAAAASIVVCGHSHVPFVGRDRDMVVFNPGSLGPRRFQLPILFGMIEASRASIELRHIDAATGERWTP